MKNAHGRTCKRTKAYIYLYISLYENLFENGCIYIYIYIYMKKCLQHEKMFKFNTKPTLLKSCLSSSYVSVVLADIIRTFQNNYDTVFITLIMPLVIMAKYKPSVYDTIVTVMFQ